MRTVLRIFWRDVRRIVRNPVALVVTLGVAVVPALYAWLNILSNWDPYVNTADIAVAVVNEDEGADVEGQGHINAGNLVVAALKENDQIGWTFVDEQDALEGVRAGTYYAAIVMPEDFTEQLASVIDGGRDKASFTYYVNEKANAIAPKVTDTGADTIETQIDNQFVGVVYGTVIDRVQEFMGGALSTAEGDAATLADDIGRARDTVDGLAEATDDAVALIDEARDTVAEATDTLSSLEGTGTDVVDALAGATDGLADARRELWQLSSDVSTGVSASSATLLDLVGRGSADVSEVAGGIQLATSRLSSAVDGLEETLTQLEGLRSRLRDARSAVAGLDPTTDAGRQAQQDLLERLDGQIDALTTLITTERTQLRSLRTTLAGIRRTTDGASDLASALGTGTSATLGALSTASGTITSSAVPAAQSSLDSFSDAAGQLSGAAAQIDPTLRTLEDTLGQLDSTLQTCSEALAGTKGDLEAVSSQLGEVTGSLSAVGASQAWQAAESVLGLDSDAIKDYMSAPVELDSIAVYPVANYGSGIAPFFTNVALWVGGIALIAIYRIEVDEEGVGEFRPWQGYLGRWLLFVLVGQLQAVAVVTGDLVIGIQCLDVGALYFAASVASFTYVNIIYSLAVAFKHIGKALAFILIIMQVPGSSGTYPIEMMPDFFQAICPWLPFTYSNNAMREAIAGYYGSYYVQNLAILLLFVVPALVVGMGLRRALLNINYLFDEKLAETDLMLHEQGGLTETRMGVWAIAEALMHTERYHDAIRERADDFERSYPTLVRRGLVALFVVPLALLVALFATGGALPLLVIWIVSMIAIDTYLIVVEYLHDRMARYAGLADMSQERLSDLVEQNLSARMRAFVTPRRQRLRERAAARRGRSGGDGTGGVTGDGMPPDEGGPAATSDGPTTKGGEA